MGKRISCHSSSVDDVRDRLGTLPDDVLHYIFSDFDIKLVIQTCIFSKRWRYFWTTTPFLHFSSSTFYSKTHPDRRFDDFVTKVLNSRCEYSRIETLRVFSYDECSEPNIESWVHLAVTHGIQILDLKFYELDFQLIELPASLFTCQSLTNLTLELTMHDSGKCIPLFLPDSIHMPHLESLSLCSVSGLSTQFLDKFVSGCPLLERLDLSMCMFDHTRRFVISIPRLKHLVIRMCKTEDHRECLIAIEAPNLNYFRCIDSSKNSYRFRNVSSLENVHLDLDIPSNPNEKVKKVKRVVTCEEGKYRLKLLTLNRSLLEYR